MVAQNLCRKWIINLWFSTKLPTTCSNQHTRLLPTGELESRVSYRQMEYDDDFMICSRYWNLTQWLFRKNALGTNTYVNSCSERDDEIQ